MASVRFQAWAVTSVRRSSGENRGAVDQHLYWRQIPGTVEDRRRINAEIARDKRNPDTKRLDLGGGGLCGLTRRIRVEHDVGARSGQT